MIAGTGTPSGRAHRIDAAADLGQAHGNRFRLTTTTDGTRSPRSPPGSRIRRRTTNDARAHSRRACSRGVPTHADSVRNRAHRRPDPRGRLSTRGGQRELRHTLRGPRRGRQGARRIPAVRAQRATRPPRPGRRDAGDAVRRAGHAWTAHAALLPVPAVARTPPAQRFAATGHRAGAHLAPGGRNGVAGHGGEHPARGDRGGPGQRRSGHRPAQPADALHLRRRGTPVRRGGLRDRRRRTTRLTHPARAERRLPPDR